MKKLYKYTEKWLMRYFVQVAINVLKPNKQLEICQENIKNIHVYVENVMIIYRFLVEFMSVHNVNLPHMENA